MSGLVNNLNQTLGKTEDILKKVQPPVAVPPNADVPDYVRKIYEDPSNMMKLLQDPDYLFKILVQARLDSVDERTRKLMTARLNRWLSKFQDASQSDFEYY